MQMRPISTENAVHVPPSPDVAKALLKARLLGGVADNFAGVPEVTSIVQVPRGDLGKKADWLRLAEWSAENDQLVLKYYGCGPMPVVRHFDKLDDGTYYTPNGFWTDEVTVAKLVD